MACCNMHAAAMHMGHLHMSPDGTMCALDGVLSVMGELEPGE